MIWVINDSSANFTTGPFVLFIRETEARDQNHLFDYHSAGRLVSCKAVTFSVPLDSLALLKTAV